MKSSTLGAWEGCAQHCPFSEQAQLDAWCVPILSRACALVLWLYVQGAAGAWRHGCVDTAGGWRHAAHPQHIAGAAWHLVHGFAAFQNCAVKLSACSGLWCGLQSAGQFAGLQQCRRVCWSFACALFY